MHVPGAVAATALFMTAVSATEAFADPSAATTPSPIVVAFDDSSRAGDATPTVGAGPTFQVNLCNKSAYDPVWVVVAYKFRPDDRDFTAAGWYRVDVASCRPFRGAFGNFGKIYFGYYAEWQGGKRVWEGNRQTTICVDAKKAFRRPLTKGYVCGAGEKLVKAHSMWVERSAPVQSVNLN